jgi:hypothetical protein
MRRPKRPMGPYEAVRGVVRVPCWDPTSERYVDVKVTSDDLPRIVHMIGRLSLDTGGYPYCALWDVERERVARIPLHRFIARAPEGLLVDHRNRNRTDARRSNLRWATPSQNSANRTPRRKRSTSSRFVGVTWHRQAGRWQAGIKHRDRFHHLGLFANEGDAARAYNRKSRELHGAFGWQNRIASHPSRRRHDRGEAA